MSVEEKQFKTVVVKGKGENKTKAVSDALSNIQKMILKETNDVVLRIEPKSIEVISAVEFQYTEKFLFFFMPRQRTSYEVELRVETEMLMIHTNKITFEHKEGAKPESIRIPFTSKSV